MKPFSEMIVVTVTPYSGTTTPDKNGNMPVMLQCMAGRMPNRNVLSGTVAARAGFELGKTYLAQVREQGIDAVFGPQFSFIKVDELHGTDIIRVINEIGPAEILNVQRNISQEELAKVYTRKGDAVESLITKRIKEGNFKPVMKRDFSHATASSIKAGSTIQDSENQDVDKSAINK